MAELRKAVVKSRKVELSGDWEGWWFITRTNPPMQVIADLLSGNLDRMMEACKGIVLEWNFVDENGDPLPSPKEGGIYKVPTDLFQAVSAAAGNAPFEVEKN